MACETAPNRDEPLAVSPGRMLFPILCLLALAGQIGSFLYLPALPSLTEEFGATVAEAQGTVAAFLFGSLAGFGLYGPIADAAGRAATLAAAGAVFIAGSVLCALAPDITWLTAARVVQGLGSVAGVVTARAVIRGAWPPAGAARAMSQLTAVNTLAPAVSPIAGAILLTVIDWRAGFWVTAVIGIVATLTGALALPSAPRRPRGGTLSGIRLLFSSRTWVVCVLISGGCNSTFLVVMAGSPFVYMSSLGLEPVAYSLVMAAVLTAFAIVAGSLGGIAGRIGPRRAMLLALPPLLIGASGAAISVYLDAGLWPLSLALAMMVGGMGIIVPSGHIAMLMPFPDRAATAASLAMMLITALGAVTIWLYGHTLAGSVTGFGIAVFSMSSLIALFWTLLPRDGEIA